MKNIPVYYSFAQQNDQYPNLFAIANVFPTLDEFKIRHVLQHFPFPLDSHPYHLRFKTYCEETEPKMQFMNFIFLRMAWIDISNYNAKVPLVNNAVYIKILELPNEGLSKIYNKAKLQAVLNVQKNQLAPPAHPPVRFSSQQNKSNQPNPEIQVQPQQPYPWQLNKSVQQQPVYQQPVQQQSQPLYPWQQQQTQVQNLPNENPSNIYYQQQKILDNLLDDDLQEPVEFQQAQQANEQEPKNIVQSNQEYQERQQFGDFSIAKQQQSSSQKQVSSSNNVDLNLLESEDEPPPERQKLKDAKQKQVQQRVQEKSENLKAIWDNEEKYTQWRQSAKEQLEPSIQAWAERENVRNNIRILLASLHEILWPEVDWQRCSVGELLTDGKVKAIRLVHPDKNQTADYRQRYISERVFYELNQAWNAYRKNTEN